MSAFDDALRFLLDHEGEWGKVPGDLGGKTRWGISSVAHPEIDLDKLTISDVSVIYRTRYWDAIRGDEMLSQVARVVFDRAVLDGAADAVRDLQDLFGLNPDGKVGSHTLEAVFDYGLGPRAIAHRLLQRWAVELAHRCQQSAVKRNALPGWWVRTVDLAFEIGQDPGEVELAHPVEPKTA